MFSTLLVHYMDTGQAWCMFALWPFLCVMNNIYKSEFIFVSCVVIFALWWSQFYENLKLVSKYADLSDHQNEWYDLLVWISMIVSEEISLVFICWAKLPLFAATAAALFKRDRKVDSDSKSDLFRCIFSGNYWNQSRCQLI